MKKSIKLFLATLICSILSTQAQNTTQMKMWYISPYVVDVTDKFPQTATVGTISSNAPSAQHVANGIYDSNLDLVFYFSDGNIFDRNNVLIGSVPLSTAEVCIVPFGDNGGSDICKHKYNIFTLYPGSSGSGNISLIQSVLDMSTYTLTSNELEVVYVNVAETGAIAVGQSSASTGDRHLYYLAGPGNGSSGYHIRHWLVHNNGTVTKAPAACLTCTVGDLYPTPSNPDTHTGFEFLSNELDISPDGKHLAWASYVSSYSPRYYILELDANGDYVSNSFIGFDVGSGNTTVGFRGVEFDATSSFIFVGNGADGIYQVDIGNTNNSIHIFGSNPDYGYSQLEMANNGYIYASSASGDIVAIDQFLNLYTPPSTTQPPFHLTYINSTPPKANAANVATGDDFYTLPDQIDGEDYDNISYSGSLKFFISSFTATSSATWSYSGNPWSISSGVIHVAPNSIITIPAGKNIVMDGMTFAFEEGAKVIIEPGGSLTLVNGSVLKNGDCGNTWQGVEVWGNSSLSQYNLTNQGKLEVLTGSKIEHAKCGARNWDANNLATTGGIIIGNNGNFLNNAVDVEFNTYQNYYPSNHPIGDKSYFVNCRFETTNDYIFTTAPVHISLRQCDGIKFKNCIVTNNTSITSASMAGIGINAFEAGFNFSNDQLSSTDPSFNKLYRGIFASKNSVNHTYYVTNSYFENNVIGIYNNTVNNEVITNNLFNVCGLTPLLGLQSAIILRNSSGFTIEENRFTTSNNSSLNYGVRVYDAKDADNEIYKNSFLGLKDAIQAIGINRNNSAPTTQGLQFLCNLNSGNTSYDFYVGSQASGNGVRLYQGTAQVAAGNTFSHIGIGSSDFNNNTPSLLSYYYNVPLNPASNMIYNVNPLIASNSNLCASHINNGTIKNKLNANQVQDVIQTYDSSESAYLNVLYTYNQLIDGGNTNALLNQIQLSWPQDAWNLRSELLSMSPYLSQDILLEAANRNILPQAMLLEICLANPDATKDMDFIRVLQYEIPNPLPQYMIDLIVDSWDDNTNRTALQSSLAFYSHQMAMAGNTLLADLNYGNFFNYDSLIVNDLYNYNDSLNYWLNRIQTLTAKYDLVENYLSANDIYAAQNELNNIPSNFNLSEDQSQDYDSYLQYFNFRKDVFESGRTIRELTENEIQQLRTFAESGNNLAEILAQNLLCAYYQICFDVDFETPEDNNRMMHHTSNGTSNEINSLQVAPNPAYTQTTFSYNFPLLKESATLLVCDITGRVVKQFIITNHIGQLLWDTRDVPKGLYFYNAKEGKKLLSNGKVAVEK